MIRTQAAKFLGASAITGWTAFLCTIAAVAIPTAVRAALNGVVTGCEFTPYLPFVLVSAIMSVTDAPASFAAVATASKST